MNLKIIFWYLSYYDNSKKDLSVNTYSELLMYLYKLNRFKT